MSTIRDTIAQSLRSAGLSNYTRQAEPVVAALESRENQIKAHLRTFAQRKGLGSTEVDNLFIEAGLDERPAPAQVPNTPGDEADMLATVQRLSRQVQALTDAARRHGVTV